MILQAFQRCFSSMGTNNAALVVRSELTSGRSLTESAPGAGSMGTDNLADFRGKYRFTNEERNGIGSCNRTRCMASRGISRS